MGLVTSVEFAFDSCSSCGNSIYAIQRDIVAHEEVNRWSGKQNRPIKQTVETGIRVGHNRKVPEH